MPQSEIAVKTDFNIPNSNFSNNGFLQYVIRYGGSGGKSDLLRSSDNSNNADAQNLNELLPLRKYILENSDIGDTAKQIINRMFITTGVSVSQDPTSLSTLSKQGVADVKTLNSAIKCPPTLTVTPVVSLRKPGQAEPFCTNEGLGIQLDRYRVVLSSINLAVSSNKNVGGGTFPVYAGSFVIKVTELNKQKQTTDILKKIGSDPDLSYIFDPKNEYELHLTNRVNTTVKNDAKKLKKSAEYEALTKTNLKLLTSTIKYELTSWKPQQNEAVFTITFSDTTTAREALVKEAVSVKRELSADEKRIISEQKKAKAKVKGSDLTQAILLAIRNNGSLFNYEFEMYSSDDKKNSVKFYQDYYSDEDESSVAQEIRTKIGERNKIIKKEKSEGDAKITATRSYGSFFLMRSLLAAIMQVASEKNTTLDKAAFKRFITPAADKAYLFIDESSVPSELGTGVLGLGDGHDDFRATLESLVVPFDVFDKFMEELYSKVVSVTVDYFFEEVLSDLVQRVLLSSRSKTTRSDYNYYVYPARQGVGAGGFNNRHFGNMSQSRIRDAVGDGYKASFKQLLTKRIKNPEEPYKTKNEFIKQDEGRFGRSHRRQDGIPIPASQLSKVGRLRIKKISHSDATEVFNVVGTTQDERSFVVLLNRKGTHHSAKIDPSAFTVFLRTDESQLHKQGILLINPFMRNALNESINYRIVSDGANTPFRFSILDNKNVETIRRLRAGDPDKPFIKNIHTVDVTFRGAIGFAPFKHRIMFPPSYFYGGQGRGKTKDDVFGFAGVYVINKVSISLQEGSGGFEVSLTAQFEKEVLNKEDAQTANNKKTRKKSATQEKINELIKQRNHQETQIALFQKNLDKLQTKGKNNTLTAEEQATVDKTRGFIAEARKIIEAKNREIANTRLILPDEPRKIER